MTYSDFKYRNYSFETGTTSANHTVIDYSGLAVAGVPKFEMKKYLSAWIAIVGYTDFLWQGW